MNTDKLKAIYHTKFSKGISRKSNRMEILLDRAWEARDNHPVMISNYTRLKGPTPKDRLELKALGELIKLYQSLAGYRKVAS